LCYSFYGDRDDRGVAVDEVRQHHRRGEQQAGAELELLIEHRPDGGPVSAWMSARQPGDSFDVQGPLGHFGLVEGQDVGQAFLGSRAGLAPLRSMIHSALAHGGTKPVWLFLGAHGAADLLLDAEWRALDAKEARFHYLPVIQPTAENPFQGKNSDPADELLKKIAQRTGVRIYLAGFSKDVDPMLAKLKAAGFADTDLKAEKFG
jgi:NAD(P)H-flavin reductase